MLLEYGYMRNNLVHLGGHPTDQDVADMSDLFCFYFVFIWSRWWRAYQDLTFQTEMGWTKIDVNTSGSLSRQKLCKCVCTNLN